MDTSSELLFEAFFPIPILILGARVCPRAVVRLCACVFVSVCVVVPVYLLNTLELLAWCRFSCGAGFSRRGGG